MKKLSASLILVVVLAYGLFSFNTEAAEENCNNCEESYEYSEYSCHLNIPNSESVYPIVSTQNKLEQSLSDLNNFCQKIAENL